MQFSGKRAVSPFWNAEVAITVLGHYDHRTTPLRTQTCEYNGEGKGRRPGTPLGCLSLFAPSYCPSCSFCFCVSQPKMLVTSSRRSLGRYSQPFGHFVILMLVLGPQQWGWCEDASSHGRGVSCPSADISLYKPLFHLGGGVPRF